MIRVGSIVLRVDDLQRQEAFWLAALDDASCEEGSDAVILADPEGDRFCVVDASERRGR